ncbi:phage baseplate assembly protein V [Neisseriaceae bacterium TC5R-5]|nr:phage baseplate assembly protein V [Neisseriaceae bacterium TC5R-5]
MWNDVDQRIRRAFGNVRQGFRAVVGLIDSQGEVQTGQLAGLAGEQLQDVELFQHYGYTANPPPGSMAMVLPLGGNSEHSIVIATEHGDFRLKQLKSGEVALYTNEGSKIVLKQGRLIEVECDSFVLNCKKWQVNASEQASFSTPQLNTSAQFNAQGQINGNGGLAIQGGSGASVKGSLSTSGDVVAGGKSLQGHTHRGDSGGTTSAPL